MKTSEDKKKQVPLRISDTLFKELSEWAKDDFRSINGQIEYLLTECVKWRKRKGTKEEPGVSSVLQETDIEKDKPPIVE